MVEWCYQKMDERSADMKAIYYEGMGDSADDDTDQVAL
jgi:hypothetical protein